MPMPLPTDLPTLASRRGPILSACVALGLDDAATAAVLRPCDFDAELQRVLDVHGADAVAYVEAKLHILRTFYGGPTRRDVA